MSRWTRPLRTVLDRRPVDSSPVPLAARNKASNALFGYSPTQSMYTYLMAYANDPVIRPIVARLFQAVSAARWRLFVRSTTGDDQDRTEVVRHPLLDLLAKPNPFQTFPEIVARGQQHWELTGETSIVLGFQGGIKYPIDMWVLRPDRIHPVPDPYDFLAGWIYTAPGDNEKIPLKTTELLRMVDPSPVDPYRGMGAVQSLLRDLDSTRYAKEWQANFFANSAQPGGMISVDRRLDDAEFEEMSVRWGEQHQGVSKAHRVAILEQAEWVQNSFSLKDLQMVEMEALGRDKTLAAFGMPKSMIGIVEDVNRANAEAGEYMFASEMTKPRLVQWRTMLNQQLLPIFDPQGRLELDFDDPVPENSEANIAELKTKTDVLIGMAAAGFDVPETQTFLDLPDIPWTKPEVVMPGNGGDFAEGVSSPIQTPDTPATHGRGKGTLEMLGELGATHPELVSKIMHDHFDMAMRWQVKGHLDSSCCEPCEAKIGTLYRNRQSAYADYPPGQGYIGCIGAQYGNHCRCTVVKRRSQRDE